ncbi:NAD(P)-dependent oxidoreductase [Kitasatospora sp. NPDC058218]|uniref:NAD(P)-dependent oxidoreductase n=1 Tax=Kitasatospora sp. NPDC058218 TaxID=3346385 RepID=UPI0036DAEF88
MDRARVLLLDAAPGELLAGELERLLGHGLEVTLNLRRVADHPGTRAAWGDRVAFVDVDAFDESARIVGLGRIGSALAERASALGMAVRGLARHPADAQVPTAHSLPALVATSDVVSLHLPLTPQTRGLIGRTELALMRPGSILLNTARGGIVDEAALAEALRDPGHPLAAAAVDTFEHEHAAFASPLFGLPNALLTPHAAGMTRGAMATAARHCADHLAALLAGRPDGIPVVAG